MSNEWIEVDPEALANAKTRKVNGVRITFMPSPYDIPEAFRGFFDEAIQRFVIQFQYIGEEDTVVEPYGEYVTLRVGKNSGRVYGIEVDVHAAKAQWVELIQQAIEERSKQKRKPQRPQNYELARKLVTEQMPQLAVAS